ncbi:MAG: beta-propeller domain-containing protein, partial [Lachnospiraceae bacterium]|nr:beta-propeller domain-containing protein [Lachnospiraceae bacterium]
MTDLEKRIKNEQPDLPESISPESMRKKLEEMNEAELLKRAAGDDVPVMEKEEKGRAQVKSFRRYINPLATAAALFIVLGIGVYIGKGGFNLRGKTAMESASEQMDGVDFAEDYMQEATADEAVMSEETAGAYEEPEAQMKKSVSAAVSYAAAGDDEKAQDDSADREKEASAKIVRDADEGDSSSYDDAYAYFENLHAEYEKVYSGLQHDFAVTDAISGSRAALSSEAAEAADDLSAAKTAGNEALNISESPASDTPEHSETNIRTEGVMEADIVKTDGRYIYVYDEGTVHIRIYEADNGQITRMKGNIGLYPEISSGCEFYVQGDRLIAIGQSDDERYREQTKILVYDISDRNEPKLYSSLQQDGEYYSSRLTDGCLYTFSKKRINHEIMDKNTPSTYVPMIGDDVVPERHLFIQKKAFLNEYVVMTSLKTEEKDFTDERAVLGGGDLLYVSKDRIYLGDTTYDWSSFARGTDTQLMSFAYGDGLICKEAESRIPGYLNDDYSLDEKNGHLRAVTTYDENGKTYNALYILDEKLEGISVLKRLAEGETVKSA